MNQLIDKLEYIRDMADEMLEILDDDEPLQESLYAFERFLRFNDLVKLSIEINKLTEQLMMAKKYRKYIVDIIEESE